MRSRVQFSMSRLGADRVHHVNEDDVRVVLGRLPADVRHPLRGVHFNDRSFGGRWLGYANPATGDIALCALPPRMALTRFLRMGQTPEQFGAQPGRQWPLVAIRRFLLYDVLLHELGHLQPVAGPARSKRLTFPREKLAQEFAMEWCGCLWAERFSHPDPVHNPPRADELAQLNHIPQSISTA